MSKKIFYFWVGLLSFFSIEILYANQQDLEGSWKSPCFKTGDDEVPASDIAIYECSKVSCKIKFQHFKGNECLTMFNEEYYPESFDYIVERLIENEIYDMKLSTIKSGQIEKIFYVRMKIQENGILFPIVKDDCSTPDLRCTEINEHYFFTKM